jgi:hypothetical protein
MSKVKEAHMQAFPFIEPEKDDNIKAYHPGMTMRDEFAKAAMQGLLSDTTVKLTPEDFAATAYMMADAMLKARK